MTRLLITFFVCSISARVFHSRPNRWVYMLELVTHLSAHTNRRQLFSMGCQRRRWTEAKGCLRAHNIFMSACQTRRLSILHIGRVVGDVHKNDDVLTAACSLVNPRTYIVYKDVNTSHVYSTHLEVAARSRRTKV